MGCNRIDVSPNLSKAFIKFYGGNGSEISSKMLLLNDGSFLMLGTSSSFNTNDTTDIYLVKSNDKGNKIWEKNYGNGLFEIAEVIRKSTDNTVVMLGTSGDVATGNASIYLAKINPNDGALVWQKTLKNNNKSTYGYDLSVDASGSIFVVGATDTLTNIGLLKNVYITKLNADGSENNTIPTLGLDSRNNLARNIIDINGNEVSCLVNTTISVDVNGSPQTQASPIFVNIKLDVGRATLQVNKSSPQIGELSIQNANQMKKTADGGYIVVGSCIKNGVKNMYLLKLDKDFNKTDGKGWFQFYSDEGDSEGLNVIQCTDGGYAVCGTTFSNTFNNNIALLRTNANGDALFMKNYGGTGNDLGTDITQTNDGGFAILSTIELLNSPQNRPVMSLLKTNANGNLEN
ncbi:MAG: hypothetical protein ACKVOU_12885 [Cytophagales bacterium]